MRYLAAALFVVGLWIGNWWGSAGEITIPLPSGEFSTHSMTIKGGPGFLHDTVALSLVCNGEMFHLTQPHHSGIQAGGAAASNAGAPCGVMVLRVGDTTAEWVPPEDEAGDEAIEQAVWRKWQELGIDIPAPP